MKEEQKLEIPGQGQAYLKYSRPPKQTAHEMWLASGSNLSFPQWTPTAEQQDSLDFHFPEKK